MFGPVFYHVVNELTLISNHQRETPLMKITIEQQKDRWYAVLIDGQPEIVLWSTVAAAQRRALALLNGCPTVH